MLLRITSSDVKHLSTESLKNETIVPDMGAIRSLVALVGAQIIYFLIWLFGKRTNFEESPWLKGPLGGAYIGDQPYEECARDERLTIKRDASAGGLIDNFDRLAGESFDVTQIDPRVRGFYENTAEYRMDVWAQTYFPANIALWLLVTTISRKVNQLNFPVRALDTAKGMTSEIVLLNEPDGRRKYTGWFRKIVGTDRVIYTGFYMLEKVPLHSSLCVKVVFPMPDGNATVILRPEVSDDGALILTSDGLGFGDVGFYRIQKRRGQLRAWRIRSLRERFCIYVDQENVVRCDHSVRFLGIAVLTLHYRIQKKT